MSRPSHYNSRYKQDLSPRQQRVIELIAKGRTNAEIAEAMALSLDGVKWHVRELLAKLELESREEAGQWWREYQRPHARAARAIAGFAGLGLWKTTAAAGGLAAFSAIAVAGSMTFRGGLAGAQADDTPPACTAENMRWETKTERVGDSTRLTLSIGLREPDWYEGTFRALRISDRKVDSPCLLRTDASVELGEMGPLPDWPPERGPAPLVLLSKLEGVTGNGPVELDTELKRGPATPVLFAEISNWCRTDAVLGASLGMPAPRPVGTTAYQGVGTEIHEPPACTDPGEPIRLAVTSAEPSP